MKREIKTLAKRHRKVLIKLFQKFAVSKGRALVARRNERNSPFGVFFLLAFSFAPFASKEKADKRLYVAGDRRTHLGDRWSSDASSISNQASVYYPNHKNFVYPKKIKIFHFSVTFQNFWRLIVQRNILEVDYEKTTNS